MLGKIESKRRKGWQRMKWLDSITDSVDMSLNKFREIVKDREAWCTVVLGVARSRISLSDWTTIGLCIFRRELCTSGVSESAQQLLIPAFYSVLWKMLVEKSTRVELISSSLKCLLSLCVCHVPGWRIVTLEGQRRRSERAVMEGQRRRSERGVLGWCHTWNFVELFP